MNREDVLGRVKPKLGNIIYQTRTGIALLTIMLGTLQPSAVAEDYRPLLDQFREDVTGVSVLGSGYVMSSAGKKIRAKGPNILPTLAKLIRTEKHGEFATQLFGIFLSIGRFDWYTYVPSASSDLAQYHPVENDLSKVPYLSINADVARDGEARLQRYFAWWDQRDSFLTRMDCDQVVTITGKTVLEALNFDKSKSQLLTRELGVYGIYAIPCYISATSVYNNPVAFLQFLKVTGNPLGWEVRGIAEPVAQLQKSHPTAEDKMALVCSWWEEAAPTYTELADLHAAIDKEIRAYCTETEVEKALSSQTPEE